MAPKDRFSGKTNKHKKKPQKKPQVDNKEDHANCTK